MVARKKSWSFMPRHSMNIPSPSTDSFQSRKIYNIWNSRISRRSPAEHSVCPVLWVSQARRLRDCLGNSRHHQLLDLRELRIQARFQPKPAEPFSHVSSGYPDCQTHGLGDLQPAYLARHKLYPRSVSQYRTLQHPEVFLRQTND